MGSTKQSAIKVASIKRGLSVDEYLEKTKTHKFCSKCKLWKLKSIFNVDNSRCDKLAYKCNDCYHVKLPYKSLKGRTSTFKGKKHTEETKRIISEKNKGKQSPMKGRNHSLESRLKISQTRRSKNYTGKNCPAYKDGKTTERRGIRFSFEYKRWRYDVFFRDNFTCQNCGDNKGGNLNAHHIKHFADHPDLRFEVSNGITLCEDCHKKEHSKN